MRRNRSRLTAEAREAILNANPSMRRTIEGHTEDLGSDEHNLALGQRRAAAAKHYLTQRDIYRERTETASFGEERPTCQDTTDDRRARNRRDEFRITAGEPVAVQRRQRVASSTELDDQQVRTHHVDTGK
jgi:peptidoglycan-associated lipoprotein